jgi:RES domain-containing protein
MFVYRIVKSKKRTKDLSGIGAYLEGGRWNNEDTFALYTSENQDLAMLELLVHIDESELPPNMFVMKIEIDDSAPILKINEDDLPKNWRVPDNNDLKEIGDKILENKKHIAVKTPSAVMPGSYNYVLNPLYPDYHDQVKVVGGRELLVDKRLK